MSNEIEDSDVRARDFALGGYPTVFAERVRDLLFAPPVSHIQELDPSRSREPSHAREGEDSEVPSEESDDDPANVARTLHKGRPQAPGER